MANNLPFEKKVTVVSMLCEGSSIRAVERITGVNRNTIMSLAVRVGAVCKEILDIKMRALECDALAAYPEAIERGFGGNVDYAQLVKTYAVTNLNKDAASRYSPAEVVKAETKRIMGHPDGDLVSTSHVEKQNHTLRMHCRRLTRLTNAFSKKLENFEAAVALNFAYYNFCKIHGAIRMTPAMAARVEKSIWTVADLVKACGE